MAWVPSLTGKAWVPSLTGKAWVPSLTGMGHMASLIQSEWLTLMAGTERHVQKLLLSCIEEDLMWPLN